MHPSILCRTWQPPNLPSLLTCQHSLPTAAACIGATAGPRAGKFTWEVHPGRQVDVAQQAPQCVSVHVLQCLHVKTQTRSQFVLTDDFLTHPADLSNPLATLMAHHDYEICPWTCQGRPRSRIGLCRESSSKLVQLNRKRAVPLSLSRMSRIQEGLLQHRAHAAPGWPPPSACV